MRERIIMTLFMLAHIFSLMADDLRTPDNEEKEYVISAFGRESYWC